MSTREIKKEIPGRSIKPGDIYMMLSPEGKIRAVEVGNMMYDNFQEFMQDAVYYTKNNGDAPYPNDFLLHYRCKDSKELPHYKFGSNESEEQYHQRIFDTIKDQGLQPYQTIRLYTAMYCYENGLNPLLPQYSAAELRQQPAYNSAEIRYSGYGERTDDSTYHAIETDKGVVLFDGTQHGESLQQKYIDFHVKNYFDERLDITFLKKIDVIPDAGQLAKVNPSVDALYSDRPVPFGMLPASAYCNPHDFKVVSINDEYDMAPTNENFIHFVGMDNDIISLPMETYDISALLWLADPKCDNPEIVDEWPNFFSYHDKFDPLEERFQGETTNTGREKVMTEIREMARNILKEDFPNIRQASSLREKAPRQENHNPAGETKQNKTDDIIKNMAPSKVSIPSQRKQLSQKKKGGLKF